MRVLGRLARMPLKCLLFLQSSIGMLIKDYTLESANPKQISLMGKNRFGQFLSHFAVRRAESYFNKKYIIDASSILYGENIDCQGEKIVLLAHFDAENNIERYVQEHIKVFKNLGKKVILCTNGQYTQKELSRIQANAAVQRTCAGYDFTSWKAAFQTIPCLYKANEITLSNDSVFISPNHWHHIYETMDKLPCDFWGLTASRERVPHLQSYHLVFKKNVIESQYLKSIWDAIPPNLERDRAIEYELHIGIWLQVNGFRPGAFFTFLPLFRKNPTLYLWRDIIKKGCPIFKRSLLLQKKYSQKIEGWEKFLLKNKFPVIYMNQYMKRIKHDLDKMNC